jgi:hypothetical protein
MGVGAGLVCSYLSHGLLGGAKGVEKLLVFLKNMLNISINSG